MKKDKRIWYKNVHFIFCVVQVSLLVMMGGDSYCAVSVENYTSHMDTLMNGQMFLMGVAAAFIKDLMGNKKDDEEKLEELETETV